MANTSLVQIQASAFELPTGQSARRTSISAGGTNRAYCQFRPAVSDQAIVSIPRVPDGFQGTTLYLDIEYFSATDTAGSVVFNVSSEKQTPPGSNNLNTYGTFGTADTVTSNITGLGVAQTASVTLTHTTPAVGDYLRFKIVRGTGTATGDVRVTGVVLREAPTNLDVSDFATVSFKSGHNLTFPSSDGASGQVLTTNGSGTLSWVDVATEGLATKTANYTLTGTDDVILGDATSGDITLTLPTAVGKQGKTYSIKQISSANVVSLATSSSQLIDDSTSVALVPYQTVTLVSNNSNWYRL